MAGGFNAPYIDWLIPGIIKGTWYSTAHEVLLGVAQDHGLLKPTRGNNILDLFFTSHQAKINRIEIMPQISDHNTVILEINLKAKTIKQKPWKIHLYNKGDWPAIQKGLADILDSLGTLQNINDMWLLFKTKCLDLMDRHIPTKLTKVRNGLP